MYYFRGTTLQTDDLPIIQYLAYNAEGVLNEKVDIYDDGRCCYHRAGEVPLSAGPVDVNEVTANWSYGEAIVCSAKEFAAMRQLAQKMAAQGDAGPSEKPRSLF